MLSVFLCHYMYCEDNNLDANLSCKIPWTGATLIRVIVPRLFKITLSASYKT
jgi:hypothetical protein